LKSKKVAQILYVEIILNNKILIIQPWPKLFLI
jgi:hypothetical protein